MMIGENRATRNYNLFNQKSSQDVKRPCIFLSHRSLDKDMVIKIGDYIMKSGVDIYLDVNDLELQKADESGNDKVITNCIQKGIEKSTHIMCLLSHNTVESWWVPYEVGYGEKANKEISSMRLKTLPEKSIPSYLKIRKYMTNINELNGYLKELRRRYVGDLPKVFDYDVIDSYRRYNSSAIITESSYYHPLSSYIDR